MAGRTPGHKTPGPKLLKRFNFQFIRVMDEHECY
jgi:hypothetical protein